MCRVRSMPRERQSMRSVSRRGGLGWLGARGCSALEAECEGAVREDPGAAAVPVRSAVCALRVSGPGAQCGGGREGEFLAFVRGRKSGGGFSYRGEGYGGPV